MTPCRAYASSGGTHRAIGMFRVAICYDFCLAECGECFELLRRCTSSPSFADKRAVLALDVEMYQTR